jgi:hypothetical protein
MEADKKADELIKRFGKDFAIDIADEMIDSSMTGFLLNESIVAEFQVKMRHYWKQVKNEIYKHD